MYRQIIGYVPSTVVPAVVSFVMIYVYTRLLTPAEYGDFSLIFSAVLVVQTSFFYAIPVALTRFYPEALRQDRRDAFLSECYTLFYIVSLLVVIFMGAAGLLSITETSGRWMMAIPLLLVRSAVVINQSVNRISFRMHRFNAIECTHAMLGFAFGLAFIQILGPTAEAVVSGLLLAAILCTLPDLGLLLLPLRYGWRAIDPTSIWRIVRFSFPLIVVDITVCLLQLSDRFLLRVLGGADALGIYTVAYNLVERPTTLICLAISTATFPIAVQIMHDRGIPAGGRQAGKNATILLSLILPGCVGLALTAPYMSAVMIGADFRLGVTALIPIVCVTALFRGLSTHCIDHLFHLAERTSIALWVYGPAAVANIALNCLLIPQYGVFGAAVAGLVSQGGATVAGWIIGRSVFPIRVSIGAVARIGAAVVPMGLLLYFFTFAATWGGLLEAVVAGTMTYAAAVILFNVDDIRPMLGKAIRRVAANRVAGGVKTRVAAPPSV